MTGAQLANALNEAAIIAGRAGRKAIAREDLDEALLRQSVGSQQSRRLTEEERRIVAYHEAGHALCRRLCRPRPAGDPQHRPARAGARLRRPLAQRGPLPALAQAAARRDRDPARRPRRRGGGLRRGLLRRRRRPRARARGLRADGHRVRHDPSHGPPDERRRWRCRPATTRSPTRPGATSTSNAQALAREAYRRARQLMQLNRECLDDLAAQRARARDADPRGPRRDLRRARPEALIAPGGRAVRGAQADRPRPVSLDRRADAAAHAGRRPRRLGLSPAQTVRVPRPMKR